MSKLNRYLPIAQRGKVDMSKKPNLYKQIGGVATEMDSINLYRNANKVAKFYNDRKNYSLESQQVLSPESVKAAHEFNQRLADRFSGNYHTPDKKKVFNAPREFYRKDLNDNQYLQRETANAILNPNSPAQLFDKRIAPQFNNVFNQTDGQDIVDVYQYDPVAVKPERFLTDSERVTRIKRYGFQGLTSRPTDIGSPTKANNKFVYKKPSYVDPRIGKFNPKKITHFEDLKELETNIQLPEINASVDYQQGQSQGYKRVIGSEYKRNPEGGYGEYKHKYAPGNYKLNVKQTGGLNMNKLSKYINKTVVEKGEYIKDTSGNVSKVTKAPTHNDSVLEEDGAFKKVKPGKGGTARPNLESVVSATHENRTGNDSFYTQKDEVIKILPDEAVAFAKQHGLNIKKPKKGISPSKLIDLTSESLAKMKKKFNSIEHGNDEYAKSSAKANDLIINNLPAIEDIYDSSLDLQESKKKLNNGNYAQTGFYEGFPTTESDNTSYRPQVQNRFNIDKTRLANSVKANPTLENSFREKYDESTNQYLRTNTPGYAANQQEAANARAVEDKAYGRETTTVTQNNHVAPNNQWMFPNLSGDAQKNMVGQTNELIAGELLGVGAERALVKLPLGKFQPKELKKSLSFKNQPKRGDHAYTIMDGKSPIGDFDLLEDDGKWVVDNVGLNDSNKGKGLGKESFRIANTKIPKGGGTLHSSGYFEGEDAKHVWKSLVKSGEAEEIGKDAWKFRESFNSEIDWSKWNKEIPENTQLMKEYNTIEQSTKKAGTWMKNPDGSAFQGTPEQFIQQNSTSFKKAFPDVLKSKNNADVFYHGSPKTFSYFNKANFGKSDMGSLGKANYITDSKSYAELYARPDGYSMLEQIKNPKGNIYEMYLNAPNVKLTSNLSKKEIRSLRGEDVQDVIYGDSDYLNMGFKGNTDIAVPFDSNMKSAKSNNGNFNMSNPNIYKSIIPAVAGGASYKNMKTKEKKQTGGNKSSKWIRKKK
jgi:hypothetical protein